MTRNMRVGKHHAMIFFDGSAYYITDLGSRNGTWVNGTRVQGAVPLHQSDMIHAGDSDFIVNWYSNR